MITSSLPTRHRRRAAFAVALGLMAGAAGAQRLAPALVSNDGNAPSIDLNAFLGAGAFYTHGFTGGGVIAANIEGGLAKNSNPMLTKIGKTFSGRAR